MGQATYGDHILDRALLLGRTALSAGAVGQFLKSNAAGVLPEWSDIISGQANNAITAGSDGLPFLLDTTVALTYDAPTTTLSFTNLAGNTTTIDLAALSTDIYTSAATLAGNVITFQPNDAGTATDFQIDLTTFLGSFTGPVAGVYTYDDGKGNTFALDVKDGISADPNNSISLGADGLPFFTETITSLSGMTAAIPGRLQYDNEAAGPILDIELISANVGNAIVAGTDGKLFAPGGITKEDIPFTPADWGVATAGLFTLTIPAASIPNASDSAVYTVYFGTGPFTKDFGLHSNTLNGDGSITLQSTFASEGKITVIA